MPRRGRLFELLIARLESAIAPGLRIESPYYVADAVTGQRREIDVVVVDAGGAPVLAIECRDRKRPADVSWIEQLATKARALGVQKTIAVSGSGFSAPALKKAAAAGIETRSIETLTNDDLRWMPTVQVSAIEGNIGSLVTEVTFFEPPGPNPFDGLDRLTFVTDRGVECHSPDLLRWAVLGDLARCNPSPRPGHAIRLPSGSFALPNQMIVLAYLMDTAPLEGPRVRWIAIDYDRGKLRARTRTGDLDVRVVRLNVPLSVSVRAISDAKVGKYVSGDQTLRGFVDAPIHIPGLEGVPASITLSVPGPGMRPRPEDWTPMFPTRPGWYWTKTPAGDERLFEVVPAPLGIHRLDAHGNPVRPETEGLALRTSPEDLHPPLLDQIAFDGWQWFGPIDQPADAARS